MLSTLKTISKGKSENSPSSGFSSSNFSHLSSSDREFLLINAALSDNNNLMALILKESMLEISSSSVCKAFFCAASKQHVVPMRMLWNAYQNILSYTINGDNIISDTFVHAHLTNRTNVIDFLQNECRDAITDRAKAKAKYILQNDFHSQNSSRDISELTTALRSLTFSPISKMQPTKSAGDAHSVRKKFKANL